ncbi:MAG: RES domain-containing protein [Betaproteobacteria bacterium]|nr:RES domain-containing protein [Betaproteobacteria bacterium]
MRLWRIATETREFAAVDLSGKGAAKNPGRWNGRGQPVVYASPTVALAMLETAAHINAMGLPLNRFLVAIEIPDASWEQRQKMTAEELPVGWDAIPAGLTCTVVGAQWLSNQSSLVLCVPSVIVPEEWVALINPVHPLANLVSAAKVRPVTYGSVFR